MLNKVSVLRWLPGPARWGRFAGACSLGLIVTVVVQSAAVQSAPGDGTGGLKTDTAADIAADIDPADLKSVMPKPGAVAAPPQGPFDYQKQTLQISGPLPALGVLPLPDLGRLLYANLLADVAPDRSAAILEATMARLGKICGALNAFQIYRYRTGARTLKLKCPGKPLFVLTVTHQGALQISGGDGSIGELSSVDGRIYSLFGKRIDAPTAAYVPPAAIDLSRPAIAPARPPVAAGATPAARLAPATVPTPASVEMPAVPALEKPPSDLRDTAALASPGHAWLWIANGIGLVGLLLGAALLVRSRRRAARFEDWGLSSDDKDVLITESREVYPDIFHHPRGFFISRGGRGKRRIFKSTFGAMLYRDYGMKLGEIRV